jgi:serine/threonine-protein kinase
VSGRREADAARRIRAARLTIGERRRRTNADVAAGRAIRTIPEAGTSVTVGSPVVLVVSQGPPIVAVPDLVGRRPGNARQALRQAGLLEGEATSVESDEPANTIVAQDPPAGTRVRAGTTVSYTISTGPPLTLVPVVRGLLGTDAVAAIEANGLVVTRTDTGPDPSIGPGSAVGTEPAGGTEVPIGSSVVLTLTAEAVAPSQDGLPPDLVLAAILLAIILLAAVGAITAARLSRGPGRAAQAPVGRMPVIRTVIHPDPRPKTRIRGGR